MSPVTKRLRTRAEVWRLAAVLLLPILFLIALSAAAFSAPL